MKRCYTTTLSIPVLVAFLSMTTHAKTSGHPGGALKKRWVSAQDKGFLQKVNGANLTEAGFTPLVLKNSSSPSARMFANHMVADHMKANDAVKALAVRKGVNLPGVAPAPARAKMRKMSRLSGRAFDAGYKKLMVADHRKAIALFEGEVRKGHDPQIKAFAAETLPTLKDHLKMAMTIR